MKKSYLFLVVLSCWALQLYAQYPNPSTPPRFLNNFSKVGILSAADEAQIEQRLDAFEQETSNEITIVIVDEINEDEPWHYATELGEKWGVGKADKDNGMVFLIKRRKASLFSSWPWLGRRHYRSQLPRHRAT
jgi:uncharacterized protein